MPPRVPRPYDTVQAGPATISFYLGDCVDVLAALPERQVDVVVTSPPYNLGIRYRTYDDGQPRHEYLEWTDRWVAAVARALAAQGSLFLNVGAKPTDPWTALDVAQAVRPHLHRHRPQGGHVQVDTGGTGPAVEAEGDRPRAGGGARAMAGMSLSRAANRNGLSCRAGGLGPQPGPHDKDHNIKRWMQQIDYPLSHCSTQ